MEGVGSTDLTGVNIEIMKKAMQTEAANIQQVLGSAGAENSAAQLGSGPQPMSEGAKEIVAASTNRGGGLDVSA